jgi:hypothetical protein
MRWSSGCSSTRPAAFPATDRLILDWDEIGALPASLARSTRMLGVCITCYNPENGPDACGRRLGRFLQGVAEGNP